ncbi:hypothetical protein ACFFX1_17940 [Dactylosporangium sucinum]
MGTARRMAPAIRSVNVLEPRLVREDQGMGMPVVRCEISTVGRFADPEGDVVGVAGSSR